MATTQPTGRQIKDGSVQRVDVDVSTVGQALITKLVQGTGVTLSSTGADAGTGDVTVNATGGAVAEAVIDDATGEVVIDEVAADITYVG